MENKIKIKIKKRIRKKLSPLLLALTIYGCCTKTLLVEGNIASHSVIY